MDFLMQFSDICGLSLIKLFDLYITDLVSLSSLLSDDLELFLVIATIVKFNKVKTSAIKNKISIQSQSKSVFQTHSWKSTSLLLVVVRVTPGSPHIHKENDKFKSQIPMV